MAEERIEVTEYAGYRGEESPRAFVLNGERVVVLRITRQWIEEEPASRERRRCFTVRGSDGRTRTLCYHEERQEWRLHTYLGK